ncbi:hypothetical protein YFHUAIHA_CDS0125 [Phage C48C1]|nr:hypothetical protein YFHUAIHA_CDS0125 [Phage C48C1]
MILGLGHPRTGTGFTSKLCTLWGLDVGHEKIRSDGIIDWRYVMPYGPYPFNSMRNVTKRPNYDHLIYNVRDPNTSLPSILFTEDANMRSKVFRSSFLKYPHSNPIEFSISSIATFDKMICDIKPDLTYRIEGQQKKLFNFLESTGYPVKYKEFSTPVNTRPHSTLDDALSHHSVSPFHQKLMHNFCDKYEYPHINF